MKEILIYGDSYVYGKIPGGNRYSRTERFSSLVQSTLGADYKIVEEGLRGRMLYGENKFFPERNGFEQFGPIVASHFPLDLIVFVLGANDCNSGNLLTPKEVANKYRDYIEKTQFWCNFFACSLPKFMVVTPPILDEVNASKAFGTIFDKATARSKELEREIVAIAEELGWASVVSSKYVTVSEIDGIHLGIEENIELAKQISKKIKTLLS